jgi:hypothetical protein
MWTTTARRLRSFRVAHGNPLRHPQGPALADLRLSGPRHRPHEHPQHPRPHPGERGFDRVVRESLTQAFLLRRSRETAPRASREADAGSGTAENCASKPSKFYVEVTGVLLPLNVTELPETFGYGVSRIDRRAPT